MTTATKTSKPIIRLTARMLGSGYCGEVSHDGGKTWLNMTQVCPRSYWRSYARNFGYVLREVRYTRMRRI